MAFEQDTADDDDEEEGDEAPPSESGGHLAFSHAEGADAHAPHASKGRGEGEEEKDCGHREVSPPGQDDFLEGDGAVLEFHVREDGGDEHADEPAQHDADEGLDAGLHGGHALNLVGA